MNIEKILKNISIFRSFIRAITGWYAKAKADKRPLERRFQLWKNQAGRDEDPKMW